MKQHLKVLLVEDNPHDTDLTREMLVDATRATFDLERVARLAHGLERLDKETFDLVLLDLSLPDSRGFETFITTRDHAPRIPIIVLTNLDDQAVAIRAVEEGAQDYLIKDSVNGNLLGHSMRYAIERKRVEEERRDRIRRIQRQQRAIVKLATHETIVSGDFLRACRMITETSAETLDVERVSVWLLNEDKTRLHCIDLFERTPSRHGDEADLRVEDCPTYFASLKAGRVIDAVDARTDPRTSELSERYQGPSGISSALDATIRMSGEVVGVICHEHTGPSPSPEPRIWHADEITFAGEIADQVMQALLNAEQRQTDEALSQRTVQLEALREVTLAITGELDLDNLLHAIVSRAIELVGGTAGVLNLHRPGQDILDFAIYTGLDSVPENTQLRWGEGMAGKVWKTGEALIVNNYGSWEGRSNRWEKHLRSMADMGVPITWGDEFLGVLEVMTTSPRTFSPKDAEILSLFAAQAAIAIQNARLFESQRQRAEEIEGLAEVVRSIGSTLDLKQVLEAIALQATNLSGSDAGAVFELEEKKPTLYVTACYNTSESFIEAINASGVSVGEGAVGRAAAERKPCQIADVLREPDYPFRENVIIDDIRSILAVPMIKGGVVLGGIVLLRKNPGSFSSHHVDLLTTLADHAAVAVENAQLHQRLREHAEHLEDLVQERTAELEAQHAETKAIMQNITEGIVVTDEEGKLVHTNPVAERWLTRTLSSEETEQLSTAIRELAREAEEQPKAMVELTDLDLELQAAPIVEPGLREGAVVVALHDVSQLKALDRMKSRFVSNVSHELRTPITTIKLLANLMSREPEDWRHYLDVLIEEADRQAELVESILDISRMDSGRFGMDVQPTSLEAMIQQLVTAYEARVREEQLTLTYHPSSLPLMTLADPRRMMQVLNNLMSNAIRYTPAGGEITISTGVKAAEGRMWVTATVADTGFGIPEDDLPNIFVRFYRGILPHEMQIPGTGLGLSIVEEIVGFHGGQVTVESEVDRGSAFTIWLLPCDEQDLDQAYMLSEGSGDD